MNRRFIKTLHFGWVAALIMPFIMVLAMLFLTTRETQRFFDSPPWIAKQLLELVIIFGPSYALMWFLRLRGAVGISALITFAVVSLFLLPVLWYWALFSGCEFFHRCL